MFSDRVAVVMMVSSKENAVVKPAMSARRLAVFCTRYSTRIAVTGRSNDNTVLKTLIANSMCDVLYWKTSPDPPLGCLYRLPTK